ncbi:hypothetical protein [Cytobacillus dafuensis]|uniref:YhfM-like domain-containing protein n=1 Tax=Cytobacillus dafuensis TaxID=1742359 RepID=A0A5B8Z8Q2_CYTDA|nr:hypothetical protein [Cytobacillus dafuensis]QED48099.1 hypothetical protein FSZ17_13095 [Cytobacillus dafuensis]
MKKSIVILLLIVVIGFIGYKMFYNGFSDIESIAIQTYDKPFKKGVITTDKDKIATITGILNRAKHESVCYELANEPSYEMEIIYKDKTNDILWIHQGFDKNKTLLYGNNCNAYFITEKRTKKMLNLLLNENN